MNRQYRISGRQHAVRNWPMWLAVAGLIASFTYGAVVVVPNVKADSALQWLAVKMTSQTASSALVVNDGRIDSGVAGSAAPTDAAVSGDPAPETVPESEAERSADACRAAMAAALSSARIEFLSSSAQIVPASRNVIAVLAALAHVCAERIEIAGHSDNLGSEAANQRISLARARSVADSFIEYGVEPQRLSVLGFGSTRPVADNATRDGRARNRRIEMSILDDVLAASGE